MTETFDNGADLERQIEAKRRELAQLQAAKRRKTLKQQEPAADLIYGSQAIADYLNELSGESDKPEEDRRWSAVAVQQGYRRSRFPRAAVFKFGSMTLVASKQALRILPALLNAMEAEKNQRAESNTT